MLPGKAPPPDRQQTTSTHTDAQSNTGNAAASPPTLALPKGGGAIRGIGEKFAANPVTGTGSMSVPIATSPGRAGFGPQLSLSYDSGAGNGPFGFGWSLSHPSITRKTDKGLPQYLDAQDSDVFVLSGAEDLVPAFKKKVNGDWDLHADGSHKFDEVTRDGYRVRRYCPRIEGLFARIERWTNPDKPDDSFWRSISKDNITTWYGKTPESRICDPADPQRIFSWLISESYDDKGNAIVYRHKAEDGERVDRTAVHERNRLTEKSFAQRYLKRIQYGNITPRQPNEDLHQRTDWMFEVVFDYGEHNVDAPLPVETGKWAPRADAFSTCRAGFEVRMYRLCQRVLMFHHFPARNAADVDEAAVGQNCLVRATEFSHEQTPIAAYLAAVTQAAFRRNRTNYTRYTRRNLPPLHFEYTTARIQAELKIVDAASSENLPYGIDGAHYQFVDLYGEGIPGVLTQQAEGWFYKRNLSPLTMQTVRDAGGKTSIDINARFAPVEQVALQPSPGNLNGGQQLMDLDGDGRTDLVQFASPLAGYSAQDSAGAWQPFVPFRSQPNLDWNDPNLRHVELTGDGHADLLITRDVGLEWYRSLDKDGFEPALFVTQPVDDEQGPRLAFADGTQSVYLADMNGDGLTDLVRIRNGNVCYWPSLGYGRFGAKVTMSHAPHFDHPDQFDQKRIRLADIDGSGVVDMLYIGRDSIQVYLNQSGNSWADADEITAFPRVDNLASVQAMDLLGNGTACLVWSSPLSSDARRPMRYLDLMGGQKPHLLVKTINNLGAETYIQYAPSTKFYLQDQLAGQPWATKLPFPVHVVEKVTVTDKWRKTSFSSTYSYHHGYFDGIEREFRGFGRVEQVDVESYGKFEQGNAASPYITDDKTLYQPPIKTITWYHTGAFLDRERILSHFEHEYFPRWLEDRHLGLSIAFQENPLPQPDLAAEHLSAEEWREALRACKGMLLRQEVVELDIDALERPKNPEQLPVKLFSTAYHNCHVRRLQPKDINRHAVFLVAESEAITYHYELDIREEQLPQLDPDPRIAHTLNLQYDEYANVLQSVAVVYPRLGTFEKDVDLAAGLTDALSLIRRVQKEETHVAYSETRYTEDFGTKLADKIAALDNHRLRLPCEVLTYELTGIKPTSGLHFTLNELRAFRLSPVHQKSGAPVLDILYHEIPSRAITPPAEKRLVEHARTLFFAENVVDPLPFREHGRLGLTYETYKLALTKPLLDAIFKDAAGNNKLDQLIDGATTARAKLDDPASSGYLSGPTLVTRFASIPANELTGQYWIRSGIAGFAPDAAQHFYLPEKYTDPFDNVTRIKYDWRDLFIASSTDEMTNTTRITHFDYRVLAPAEMEDINGNLSEVYFDVLGMPTAMAVKGKGTEGDNLTGFTEALANPEPTKLAAFFVEKPYDAVQARDWLGNATARHVYYFGETIKDGKITWGSHPACACAIAREQHVTTVEKLRLTNPNAESPLQTAFEYSDGMGSVVVKKTQAEPEQPGGVLRWVASGKIILNNKGKPVKQYEPYFSPLEVGHRFEEPREEGVTSVIYYDAVGRTVRTEVPDGTFSRVEFSPWHVKSFDANDTINEPNNAWYARHTATGASVEDKRAAKLSLAHQDTPALTILDSLGREVIAVAYNRVEDVNGTRLIDGKHYRDERYLTFTKLDAEGKPLWIRDARKNLVMQYITPPVPNNQAADPVTDFAPCYDIAGNLLFQHSMDASDRWMLMDAAGKPMFVWNSQGHTFRTDYDKLHRPVGSFVKGADSAVTSRVMQFEKIVYGDTPGNGMTDAQKTQLNLRGKPYQHYDTAGLVVSKGRNPATGMDEAFDFKGNLLRSTRQLVKDYKNTSDWSKTLALEAEIFSSSSRYDALNRPTQLVAPHSDQASAKFNLIRPGYNQANLLERVDVWLKKTAEPTALLDPTTANLHAVTNIDYDAKGQRIRIEYNEAGHPVITEYTYDEATFRLIHLVTARPKHSEIDKRSLQDLSYTYDPVGNITAIRDAAQQMVFFKNSTIEPSNVYAYDALYRLIRAEGREHAVQNNVQRDAKNFEPIIGIPFLNSPEALQRYIEDYEYDPVGNILGLHHTGGGTERWVRRYQYALDSNRLLATRLPGETAKLPDYTATPGYGGKYTYDAHGNMTRMSHLPLMQWDYRDQLQATAQQVVNNGVPETTWYVYDASGQRVRKVTEDAVTASDTANGIQPKRKSERIYLGRFEIYRDYESDGVSLKLERETLHIMDDSRSRIALVETKTKDVSVPANTLPETLIRFQFGNHLGSASLELDHQAKIISYEEYHPYGTTAYQSGRNAAEVQLKRYRYTGMERDAESGLNYHGARYYAAWLGRWTSADPAKMVDGPNMYTYSSGNPIRYADPTGRYKLSISKGTFEPEETDTAEDLLFVFARLRNLGIASEEREKLLAGSLQETLVRYGADKDYATVERANIVGQIRSALRAPISSEEREAQENRMGQDFARERWKAGAEAANTGAEATVAMAGFLGTPTSKGDVVLMVGIPVAGVVVHKFVAIAKPVLGKAIAAGLGKKGAEGFTAILNVLTKTKHGNRFVEVEGRYWNLPKGYSIKNIPSHDPIGDALDTVASRLSQDYELSSGLIKRIEVARGPGGKGKEWIPMWIQQEKGRWVEAELQKKFPDLKWQDYGPDAFDSNSPGLFYEVHTSTITNSKEHLERDGMHDKVWRAIIF